MLCNFCLKRNGNKRCATKACPQCCKLIGTPCKHTEPEWFDGLDIQNICLLFVKMGPDMDFPQMPFNYYVCDLLWMSWNLSTLCCPVYTSLAVLFHSGWWFFSLIGWYKSPPVYSSCISSWAQAFCYWPKPVPPLPAIFSWWGGETKSCMRFSNFLRFSGVFQVFV